ncbi:MAG: TlpA disulfide reductase family protein [Dissulfurispiraceae bacterium]|nr:TlpA disulfide reductase family protein [Dissulfurispiraceae bacterium]
MTTFSPSDSTCSRARCNIVVKVILIRSFLAVLFIILGISGCKGKHTSIKIGEPPPQFTLPDTKGQKISLPDSVKGNVVVIRFWADWCTYCAKEMPAIEVVYQKYKDKGLIILAVNVGQPKEVAEAFTTALKISYPVLLDTYSVAAKRYGVVGLPTMFVIDRNGILREKILGEADREIFEKIVVQLL